MIAELINLMEDATEKSKIYIWQGRNNGWNGEYSELRRKAREKLRKWKNNRGRKEEYLRPRENYRRQCEERKRGKREEEEKTIKSLKTEEVWRYINKERRRKTEVSRQIKIHEWKRHFMELFGGCEGKCCKINKGITTTEEMWRGSEITQDKIGRQIERLKRYG
ncbi:hypothetical protein Zmor_003669 [Zophobas morio]|uniref:Endonuclease-reverse transcriptase n=1 Tax=Zophobas morio TaxID=2755281 RepID=A0AA38HPS1_9CUCU|nr:hypothetical protein Zmor_003669 [Zophobas morio]